MPSYLALKIQATIVRFLVKVTNLYRNFVLGQYDDWQLAFPTRTREYTIPSSKSTRKIRIRVWDAPVRSNGLRPVHVNFHGSGWIIPGLGSNSDYCKLLSERLNITVLDCDYVKAPEVPFPGAMDDCADCVAHVLSTPNLYDLSNLTVGGFSAGGSLSLVISGTKTSFRGLISGIVALYPSVDFTPTSWPIPPKSIIPKNASGILLDDFLLKTFSQSYALSEASGKINPRDPRVSPTFIPPEDLPRNLCVITAEYDSLKQEGDKFAAKMKDAGLNVAHHIIRDVQHGWDTDAQKGTIDHTRKTEAYEAVITFLQQVYNK